MSDSLECQRLRTRNALLLPVGAWFLFWRYSPQFNSSDAHVGFGPELRLRFRLAGCGLGAFRRFDDHSDALARQRRTAESGKLAGHVVAQGLLWRLALALMVAEFTEPRDGAHQLTLGGI